MPGGLETQKRAPVICQPDTMPHSVVSPGSVPEGPWEPMPVVLLICGPDSEVVARLLMNTNAPGPKVSVS